MPVYFINENDIKGDSVTISGDNFHHLVNVLRCAVGEELFVSNNKEKFRVKIKDVFKRNIEAEIISREKIKHCPEITLIQCLPKKDKMDLVVGHCTELGVMRFFPVISERSVPRLDKTRSEKLLIRWQKIAVEQAQRAGTGILPNVHEITRLQDVLDGLAGFDLILIPWEEEKSKKVKNVLNSCSNIEKLAIIIGPEGGLTAEEVNLAVKTGAVPVSLGDTILRTEIAGLAALSIIKYHLDWM